MQRKRLYVGLNVALALFVVGFIASPRSSAQDTVLYPFETMFKTPPGRKLPLCEPHLRRRWQPLRHDMAGR